MATLTVDNWALRKVVLDYADQFIPDTLIANAQDMYGRGIDLYITKSGEAMDMTGMKVYLVWRHENGNQDVSVFSAVSSRTGHFKIYYPPAMMRGGMVTARIAICVGKTEPITGSRDFRIMVEPTPINEDDAMADESFTLFQNALKDVAKMQERLDAIEVDESNRKSAESARVSAESAREHSEGVRMGSESTRAESETSRISAEQQRVDAEKQRATAESGRVSAEEARATEFDAIKAQSDRLLACPFPIGAVLQLTNNVNPNTIYPGTTWTAISGRFLLASGALDSAHSYTLGDRGGEAEVALSVEQMPQHNHAIGHTHTVPAHAHGLNSHTHTTPNHTHTVPNHVHKVKGSTTGGLKYGLVNHSDLGYPATSIPSFGGNVATNNNSGGDLNLPSGGSCTITSSGGGTTGKATGNTADSAVLTTSQSSYGVSATRGGKEDGTTAPHNNMPPYLVVNIWERVA